MFKNTRPVERGERIEAVYVTALRTVFAVLFDGGVVEIKVWSLVAVDLDLVLLHSSQGTCHILRGEKGK